MEDWGLEGFKGLSDLVRLELEQMLLAGLRPLPIFPLGVPPFWGSRGMVLPPLAPWMVIVVASGGDVGRNVDDDARRALCLPSPTPVAPLFSRLGVRLSRRGLQPVGHSCPSMRFAPGSPGTALAAGCLYQVRLRSPAACCAFPQPSEPGA